MNYLEINMPEAHVVKMHPKNTYWEVAFRPNRRCPMFAYTQLEMTHVAALHMAIDLLNNPEKLNQKYADTYTKIDAEVLEAKVS